MRPCSRAAEAYSRWRGDSRRLQCTTDGSTSIPFLSTIQTPYFLFCSASIHLVAFKRWKRGYRSHPGQGWPWWSNGRAYRRRYRAQSVLRRFALAFIPSEALLLLRDPKTGGGSISGMVGTYVVTSEVVDVALAEHGVVLKLRLAERRGVAWLIHHFLTFVFFAFCNVTNRR